MSDILSVTDFPHSDNSIVSYEIHSYNPYTDSYKENDEIRIPIQQQDLYILPSACSIYVEGYVRVTSLDVASNKNVVKGFQFSNNPIAFLFQDIRYEMNGIEIDRSRNVGITSTMKSYVSMNESDGKVAALWGWNIHGRKSNNGHFSVIIPLNKLIGFAEDYNKIILNCRHELILTRSNISLNSVQIESKDQCEITIQKIQWRMPHIKVSDKERLLLLKHVEKDRPIQVAFRNWDLYEYPMLPKTSKHSWSVKTASQIEKPRYIIFGLQTDRKNNKHKDITWFDHCKLKNITLFLNSQYYPYEPLNLKFHEDGYSILYEMYMSFRQSYYSLPVDPLLDINTFKETAPLAIIDCSRQNENIKTGPVDVRLEIECSDDIPDNTTAYCLIINDRIIEYKPLSNLVRKLS